VGKHHSGKKNNGKLIGFKTLIKPSKKAIKAHADKVKEVIKTHRTAPQYALIKRLNPVVSITLKTSNKCVIGTK
jgi:RNA-directed DNA polymerase